MTRPRERIRLEDGLRLDLNALYRDGYVKPGQSVFRHISWTHLSSGNIVASGWIDADLREDTSGLVTICLGQLKQRIRLVPIERHFGGVQWYFLCGYSGRRASVLWKLPGVPYFAARQTWGRRVAYGSQFEAPRHRAISRAQDLRYRLGGKEYLSLLVPDPPKPKGMHWCTYDQRIENCKRYEALVIQGAGQFLARLKR